MDKQTVLDQHIVVDNIERERDRVGDALGAVDYMLCNRSAWTELIDEDDINYDGLCRIIGAVEVPRSVKVGSADDMKSYLLNQHRILSDQLDMEKDKLLRLMSKERRQMLRHIQEQYDDAHKRQEGFSPESLAWHRLQAIMETYKHLMFKANQPVEL